MGLSSMCARMCVSMPYVHVCVCARACVCVRVCVHACKCARAYMSTSVHTFSEWAYKRAGTCSHRYVYTQADTQSIDPSESRGSQCAAAWHTDMLTHHMKLVGTEGDAGARLPAQDRSWARTQIHARAPQTGAFPKTQQAQAAQSMLLSLVPSSCVCASVVGWLGEQLFTPKVRCGISGN